MKETSLVKKSYTELSLDFGVGGNLALSGLTAAQQSELAYRLRTKKAEIAIDIAERKMRLESSVADSSNVVTSTQSLDTTKADFNISSESETASGILKINVHKNKNLTLYILIALGILAVVAFVIQGDK